MTNNNYLYPNLSLTFFCSTYYLSACADFKTEISLSRSISRISGCSLTSAVATMRVPGFSVRAFTHICSISPPGPACLPGKKNN